MSNGLEESLARVLHQGCWSEVRSFGAAVSDFSAEGENTRRYSNGRRNARPSENATSMTRDFWCSVIAVGLTAVIAGADSENVAAQVFVSGHFAELPIDIKVTGSYHDIGEFAADVAKMPRIVTLNNLALSTGKDGTLSLDAIAKTFRYLDQDELDAQSKARKKKKKEAKA